MPTYSYIAQDQGGKTRKGTLEAESEQALSRQLREQGLFVTKYQLASAGKSGASEKPAGKKLKLSEITLTKRKVKTKELMLFSRQFASMVGAGIELIECLDILEKQSDNPTLRETIVAVRTEIIEGNSLSEALSKHPKVFDNLYVSMIEAAQTTGSFTGPLDSLASMMEKTEEIKRKVKSALRMPLITVVSAILITLGLIKFAVPMFKGMFEQFGGELPMATKVLLTVSNALQGRQGIIAFSVVAIITVGVKKFIKTKKGRHIWDRTKLKLPVFGAIILKRSVVLFSHTFKSALKERCRLSGILDHRRMSRITRLSRRFWKTPSKRLAEGRI